MIVEAKNLLMIVLTMRFAIWTYNSKTTWHRDRFSCVFGAGLVEVSGILSLDIIGSNRNTLRVLSFQFSIGSLVRRRNMNLSFLREKLVVLRLNVESAMQDRSMRMTLCIVMANGPVCCARVKRIDYTWKATPVFFTMLLPPPAKPVPSELISTTPGRTFSFSSLPSFFSRLFSVTLAWQT